MGFSSEWAIEIHNERMAVDEPYAAEYHESCDRDAAHEAEYFAQELINERFAEWFPDWRLDHTGYEEFDEAIFDLRFDLDDEDLPF